MNILKAQLDELFDLYFIEMSTLKTEKSSRNLSRGIPLCGKQRDR